MNDLSTLNDDFTQASQYRQNIVSQAIATAEAKASQFLNAAGVDKSMVPHLKMLAGEEGGGALAAPHAVELARGAVNYARGNLLSSETNEALDAAGQQSFDATLGRVPALMGDAGSAIGSGLRAGGQALASGVRGAVSNIGARLGGGAAEDLASVGGNAVINDLTAGATPMRVYSSADAVPEFVPRAGPPPTDAAGGAVRESAAEAYARQTGGGESKAADVEAEGKMDAAIGDEVGEAAEGATAAGEGATAGVGAGGEAAAATAAAAGAGEVAEGAADVAATNWWNVLGWGAAIVAAGSAVESGIEAYKAGQDEKTQSNIGNSIKPQIPNMPSFAGRYVVPVQNSLQNE